MLPAIMFISLGSYLCEKWMKNRRPPFVATSFIFAVNVITRLCLGQCFCVGFTWKFASVHACGKVGAQRGCSLS